MERRTLESWTEQKGERERSGSFHLSQRPYYKRDVTSNPALHNDHDEQHPQTVSQINFAFLKLPQSNLL